MQIHFIMHESFEAPAAIESWALDRKHSVTYTKLHEGDSFPQSCNFDFLIIMGGPQSPETTTQQCQHFNAQAEVSFIQKAIKEGKLLLGVCLGAQFIGQALGARFAHSPDREIGVFNTRLTTEGKSDSNFRQFPDSFNVGHWHGDMPGLTADAKILAESAGCPRQIVRYAANIYGFQCHFEFTSEAIEMMIANNAEELENYKDLPFVQSADVLRKNDYFEMNQLLYSFLDNFCASTKI